MPSIHEAKAKEQEIADSKLESGRAQQIYMRSLGRAATSVTAEPVECQWETPDCAVDLEYFAADELYVGSGSYVEKAGQGGLGFGLFGPSPGSRQMLVEYKLRRVGNAFEGTVKREPQGGSAVSVLGIGSVPRKVTMMLAEGGAKLIVKESGLSASEEVWVKVQGRASNAVK